MVDEKDKKKTQQDQINAEETAALNAAQTAETEGVKAYNQAQYQNLGQIVGDIQSKIDTAKAKDETAIKRENAYRYISGLGDTISSLANLVGTAHDASNQPQVYNSHAVVQKAEEARKIRKLEMDDLRKRQDEMNARLREMKAAGSLKEAELNAKHQKELIALQSEQRKLAEEQKRHEEKMAYQKERDAAQDALAKARMDVDQKQFAMNYNLRLRELEATLADKAEKKTYPVTIKGQKYEIPVRELNDAQVGNIFSKLPDSAKAAVQGKAYTSRTTDEYGTEVTETKYEAPSLNQKIAAITEYAEQTGDAAIIAEIANLAGVKVQSAPAVDNGGDDDYESYVVSAAPAAATQSSLGPMWNKAKETAPQRKEERKTRREEAKKEASDTLMSNYQKF